MLGRSCCAEGSNFQTLRPQRKQNILFRTAWVYSFVFVFDVYVFVLDLNGLFTHRFYRKLHCSEIADFCLMWLFLSNVLIQVKLLYYGLLLKTTIYFEKPSKSNQNVLVIKFFLDHVCEQANTTFQP